MFSMEPSFDPNLANMEIRVGHTGSLNLFDAFLGLKLHLFDDFGP